MSNRFLLAAVLLLVGPPIVGSAVAQPLGTFRWQLQPYCNVVTLSVTQNGGVFRLEGTDDQCGAGGASASVTGTAFQNPGGDIGFGLNIVAAPGGAPVHVAATVSLPSLNGTWRDSAGSTGHFIFTPGAGSGGSARSSGGTIGAVAIDPSQVQLRISGACAAGLFMQSIGQNGAVGCAPAGAGGGITSVSAGTGLTGGGGMGNITLALRATGGGSFDLGNLGGFLSAGTLGGGSIAAAGSGTRLLWYPRKAAFRVGHVAGSQWDDASIGNYSFAAGGTTVASGIASVAMGFVTSATGNHSTAFGNSSVAGGSGSLVAGTSSVAGGVDSIALGLRVTANGLGSVVIGSDATATTTGTFMYGDRSTLNDLTTAGSNEFLVRAAGGTIFYSDAAMTTGAILLPGTSTWQPLGVSDEHRKTNFHDLDGEQVLTKLAAMPVREWSYTTQDAAIRHAGPTAQDFRAAFGLGESDVRIGSVDADGIALAAVKALELRTRNLDERNRRLERENDELRARLARLEAWFEKR